jgi:hypothetical protein
MRTERKLRPFSFCAGKFERAEPGSQRRQHCALLRTAEIAAGGRTWIARPVPALRWYRRHDGMVTDGKSLTAGLNLSSRSWTHLCRGHHGAALNSKGDVMSTLKIALLSAAVFAAGALSSQSASARPAWFGPGSGPVSPYANYKGFAQVPRQSGGSRTNVQSPSSGAYHCVPNVGLVGANGVCPD